MQRVRKLSATEGPKALESLLYEMLMLESALLLRDTRYCFKKYDGLRWGVPQIAHDVLRLKSRLLFDFFYSPPRRRDIVVASFGVAFNVDEGSREELSHLKARMNKWTIHFADVRLREPEYSTEDRQAMERCAMQLLHIGAQFVAKCLEVGTKLEGWAVAYHDAFTNLHQHLLNTARVKERQSPSAPNDHFIDLVDLAVTSPCAADQ